METTEKADGHAFAMVETAKPPLEKMMSLTAGDSGGSSMERSGVAIQSIVDAVPCPPALAPSSNASGSPQRKDYQNDAKQGQQAQPAYKTQPVQPPQPPSPQQKQQYQRQQPAAADAAQGGGFVSFLVDLLTCRSGAKQPDQQDRLAGAVQQRQQQQQQQRPQTPPPQQGSPPSQKQQQQQQQRGLETEDSWGDLRKSKEQPQQQQPAPVAQQRQVSQQAISKAIAALAAVEIKKGKERDAAALAALKMLSSVAEESAEGRARLTGSGAVPPLLRLIICCQEQGWPKWDAGQVTKRAADLLCLLSRDNLDFQLKLGVLANIERGDRKLTPLFDATVIGHRAVADVLLRNGANVNAADSEGWTCLHHAAAKGDLPLAKLLVKRGADIKAADNKGKTPEHVADQFGQWAMAEHLKQLRQAQAAQ